MIGPQDIPQCRPQVPTCRWHRDRWPSRYVWWTISCNHAVCSLSSMNQHIVYNVCFYSMICNHLHYIPWRFSTLDEERKIVYRWILIQIHISYIADGSRYESPHGGMNKLSERTHQQPLFKSHFDWTNATVRIWFMSKSGGFFINLMDIHFIKRHLSMFINGVSNYELQIF